MSLPLMNGGMACTMPVANPKNGGQCFPGNYPASPLQPSYNLQMPVSPQMQGSFVTNQPSMQSQGLTQNALPNDVSRFLLSISKQLTEMNKKLDRLEIVEKKLVEFDKDLGTLRVDLHDKFNSIKESVQTNGERLDSVEFMLAATDDKIAELVAENSKMREENESLKSDFVDLKTRSMRDNLLFSGIRETEEERTEGTEAVLRGFLEQKLEMTQEGAMAVKFGRVHRVGYGAKPRQIVAKFNSFKQRKFENFLTN